MKTFITIAAVFSVLFFCNCTKNPTTNNGNGNQQGDATISDRVLTQDLTFPWEILWGPDDQLWITERGGKISRVNPADGVVTPLLTISEVVSRGEGGLLGMVLHPDFSTTPEVFVAYNYDKAGVYTKKIVKFTYNGTTLITPVTLLDNIPASNIHNGTRLAISPDKKLYIASGDASESSRAQDKNNPAGKIERINLDGSIPTDNLIPGSPVWSYGHRNPQGLVFVGDRLYSSEHGNTTNDEINIIQRAVTLAGPMLKAFAMRATSRRFAVQTM